ncbi:MAG: hypothetical protein NT029_05415 [Armatimonadetes bacterium]|nr:hypothetical protein [Armatimonadota bacterium]
MDADRREEFATRLYGWYRTAGRRFPWRGGRSSAYHILVAEMMLRKTDVRKVEGVYTAFIARYPTVQCLARADERELRDSIRLLGIEDRARLMRVTANIIVSEHAGKVPSTYNALVSLPGIGRYSANAVLCFAYRRDTALVDTNIIRILGRVFSVWSQKARPREDMRLWDVAAGLVPAGHGIRHNRALLDLAATTCTPTKPKCAVCSLNELCDYARCPGRERGSAGE